MIRSRYFTTGWCLALEPMINMGTEATRILKDKWTVVTTDGLPSAHFEHSIAVTEEGPLILTALNDDIAFKFIRQAAG